MDLIGYLQINLNIAKQKLTLQSYVIQLYYML